MSLNRVLGLQIKRGDIAPFFSLHTEPRWGRGRWLLLLYRAYQDPIPKNEEEKLCEKQNLLLVQLLFNFVPAKGALQMN